MALTRAVAVGSRGERARKVLLAVASVCVVLGTVGLLLALPSVLV